MIPRKDILDYNTSWLKFAETKATLLISVLGIMLTIIYSNSSEVYEAIISSKVQMGLSLLASLSFFLTLVFCFQTINPKLKNVLSKSVIYFGSIKNYKDFKEYNSKLNKVSEKEYNKMLAEQIFINSKIAWDKYVKFGWALRFFFVKILIVFIQILIYLT